MPAPATGTGTGGLLSELRGSRVGIRVPQRGDKRTLHETVARNAAQSLALHRTKRAADLTTRNRALRRSSEALGLDEVPLRIECYDVSHSRAPRWSPRWWSSRTDWPARANTDAS